MKDHVSCLARTEARHEIVEGILSPEGMKLSLVPLALSRVTPESALAGATTPMHFKKTCLQGWSPEKMLPLALEKIVKRIARATAN
jgi:hypothetical protein